MRLAVQQLTRAGAVVDPAAAAAHLDGVVHPARQGLITALVPCTLSAQLESTLEGEGGGKGGHFGGQAGSFRATTCRQLKLS